jgi:hypothetical protein
LYEGNTRDETERLPRFIVKNGSFTSTVYIATRSMVPQPLLAFTQVMLSLPISSSTRTGKHILSMAPFRLTDFSRRAILERKDRKKNANKDAEMADVSILYIQSVFLTKLWIVITFNSSLCFRASDEPLCSHHAFISKQK